MKTYRIPLVWMMYGHMYVEAESEEEAIDKALHDPDYPMPDGEFMDDSLAVDDEVEIEVYE